MAAPPPDPNLEKRHSHTLSHGGLLLLLIRSRCLLFCLCGLSLTDPLPGRLVPCPSHSFLRELHAGPQPVPSLQFSASCPVFPSPMLGHNPHFQSPPGACPDRPPPLLLSDSLSAPGAKCCLFSSGHSLTKHFLSVYVLSFYCIFFLVVCYLLFVCLLFASPIFKRGGSYLGCAYR